MVIERPIKTTLRITTITGEIILIKIVDLTNFATLDIIIIEA